MLKGILLAFSVALLMAPIFVARSASLEGKPPASDTIPVTIPFVGTEFNVPKEWVPYIAAIVILLFVLHYIPNVITSLRDAFTRIASTRALFELEKMKYEVLKLRYEIEGLRKAHEISELSLPPELEQRFERVERKAMAAPSLSEPDEEQRKFLQQQLQGDRQAKAFILRRTGSFILDLLAYGILVNTGLFFYGITSEIGFATIATGEGDQIFYFVALLEIFIAIAYFGGMHAAFGATLGKMLFRLRVVSASGNSITVWQALIRFVLWSVTNLLWGLGFFWALWDERKLSLYDRVANTRVVYVGHKIRT